MSTLLAFDISDLLKLFTLAILVVYVCHLYNRSKYWPPGPRGLPIFGNVFQVQSLPWLVFTPWKALYGSVVSLNLAGRPMIILNTHKAASDLLNLRSTTYSGRPRFIMAGEILTGGLNIALISYNDRWRRMRRASHEGLNVQVADKYRPIQEVEAVRLVNNLLRDPDNWGGHLRRSAASSVLCSVYGWNPIEPKDDPIVQGINNLIHRMARAALPGAYLVETFPLMNHLPAWMAKWKREGLAWFSRDTKMFEEFIAGVKERRAAGSCKPCFASSLLENQDKSKLTNEEVAWLAGMMFAAGSETTASTLSVFILTMVLYPEVMRKAQAEIDEVVGRDRLPNFADYDKLPYIHAVVKEVLRWKPVIPMSAPRWASEDNWYEGYYIPKGALVVSNMGAMNRDPDLYPDYEEFRPTRFLDASGNLNKKFADAAPMGHVSYGFGRRICAGMNFANQSLFIDIACILWALDIGHAIDNQGNKIVPLRDDCIYDGVFVRPAPFVCKVMARSSDVSAVLEGTKGDGGEVI